VEVVQAEHLARSPVLGLLENSKDSPAIKFSMPERRSPVRSLYFKARLLAS
jgi:hypothetical protein